jgi:hypothetical protein
VRRQEEAVSAGVETGIPSSIPSVRLLAVPLTDRPGMRLIGEVDLSTRSKLVTALGWLTGTLEPEGEDVHLELAELTFIDVGGATLLMQRAAALRPDQRMVLHNPPAMLRRTFTLLWGVPPRIQLDPA